MAKFAWPTVLFVAFIIVAYILNLLLFVQGGLAAWQSTLIMGALTYFAYTPLHEAVHNNINGKHKSLKWLNDLCGHLVAPLIAVSYISHRYEHLTHHAFTNDSDKDPDIIMQGMQKGPHAVLFVALHFLWIQNSYVAKHHWHKASRKERTIYVAEIAFSLGWRVAFLVWAGNLSAVIVVIAGFLLGGMFTAYWFAYRPHLPYNKQGRYVDTASMVAPKWLKPVEWFWLGQNLHTIHHLFPRIPFYRYHSVFKQIKPIMQAYGTPVIGIFNRKPTP
ncbi:MAG: fatty acid desaturase [Gammaproteobacteria bacterium]|nr:fatty acid desaturase [Gammaproteobacteria bacterium]